MRIKFNDGVEKEIRNKINNELYNLLDANNPFIKADCSNMGELYHVQLQDKDVEFLFSPVGNLINKNIDTHYHYVQSGMLNNVVVAIMLRKYHIVYQFIDAETGNIIAKTEISGQEIDWQKALVNVCANSNEMFDYITSMLVDKKFINDVLSIVKKKVNDVIMSNNVTNEEIDQAVDYYEYKANRLNDLYNKQIQESKELQSARLWAIKEIDEINKALKIDAYYYQD